MPFACFSKFLSEVNQILCSITNMNGAVFRLKIDWQFQTERIKTQEFISYLEEQTHILKYFLDLEQKTYYH